MPRASAGASLADPIPRQGRATMPTQQGPAPMRKKKRVDEGKRNVDQGTLGQSRGGCREPPGHRRRHAACRRGTQRYDRRVLDPYRTQPAARPHARPGSGDHDLGGGAGWPGHRAAAQLRRHTRRRHVAAYRGSIRAKRRCSRRAPPLRRHRNGKPPSRAPRLFAPIPPARLSTGEDLLPTREGARLLFVPQGALFVVPFPALENPEGVPLVARYAISVVPSVQTLALISVRRQAAPATGPALIVGNPVMPIYSPAPGRPPLDIGPLPGAEEEARAIATLLKTSPLTGAAATKDAVMTQARSARYVHLATHGILDDVTGEGQRSANPNLREIRWPRWNNVKAEGTRPRMWPSRQARGQRHGWRTRSRNRRSARAGRHECCDSGRGAINDDGLSACRGRDVRGAPSWCSRCGRFRMSRRATGCRVLSAVAGG